jgi:predicted 3-demethylubiquinone-9 3-methyltransferase (glyoxalase superfamily)
VNAGTATVTITGIGNYRGTATRNFTINKKALEDDMIQPISAQTYNGSERRPAPTLRYGSLTLRASTDYTYAYTENIEAGTATVTVTARANSNYSGTASKTFTINPKALNDNMIQPIDDQTYTGSELEPAPVVRDAQIIVGGQAKTLVEGTDYTVAYTYNTNAGTATVTITGIGNYTGTASRNFTVLPKELEKPMVQPIADRVYTGLNIKPELTVRDGSKPLVKGVDYTTVYEDFTAAGIAKVTVTGIGNYTGTVVRNYNILQRSLADVMMEPIEDQTYTGDAIEPALKLTFDGQALKAGTDYTATYEDNVIAGTAKVTVTGAGSYSGTLTAEFTINPRTTVDGNITLVEDGVETELTINDAGTQQGKTVEEDLEVTTLNYYRTLKASDVNAYTICLPYAPPTDPNLKYYTLTSVDGTALHFDEIEGEPQAFTPYLVMASADVDISKEGYKETFTMSKEVANTSVAGSYVMKGTLSGIQHDDAVGLYIMQAGNRWAKVGSNTKAYIPPFRAYIEVTSAVPERLDSTIGGENFATEITSVCATDEDGTEHWFDLSGHPIEKPTKSGIYIHNGRKEYVK